MTQTAVMTFKFDLKATLGLLQAVIVVFNFAIEYCTQYGMFIV
jgi:hypothetical protein